MTKARDEDEKAYLVYDKLVIQNDLFVASKDGIKRIGTRRIQNLQAKTHQLQHNRDVGVIKQLYVAVSVVTLTLLQVTSG